MQSIDFSRSLNFVTPPAHPLYSFILLLCCVCLCRQCCGAATYQTVEPKPRESDTSRHPSRIMLFGPAPESESYS